MIFTATDGMPIHSQLFLPKDLKAGEKRPGLIFFHGGSRRQMLLGWHYNYYYRNAYAMNQWLASQGYVVLSVNYRSGIGYGLEFREALNYGASGGSEFNDVMGAGLYMKSRADVDPARIGLWGGSYGGYLTAMGLARASDLFAAGVDFHGVHDWNQGIRTFIPDYNVLDDPEFSRRAFASSPMSSVDTWKSPVLLIHGDDDRNVSFIESINLITALRKRNVEVEQLVFPDEVHDFLRHQNWVRGYKAAADFFNRRLKNGKPATETPDERRDTALADSRLTSRRRLLALRYRRENDLAGPKRAHAACESLRTSTRSSCAVRVIRNLIERRAVGYAQNRLHQLSGGGGSHGDADAFRRRINHDQDPSWPVSPSSSPNPRSDSKRTELVGDGDPAADIDVILPNARVLLTFGSEPHRHGRRHLRGIVEAVRQLKLERAPVDDIDGGVDAGDGVALPDAAQQRFVGRARLGGIDPDLLVHRAHRRRRPRAAWCEHALRPRRAASQGDARAARRWRRSTRSRRDGRSPPAPARVKTRSSAHLPACRFIWRTA